MNATITIHNGDVAEIRPMTQADLPREFAGEPFDPRWHCARWLGDGETEAPGFDCPAWVDNGNVFLPADGQNRSADFFPEGPDIGLGRNWYDASTGKPAVTRTTARLWPTRTGVLKPGPWAANEE